jgi:hypothetical protein
MMYQGKQLDVFMDGRPLNISTTELLFLEGCLRMLSKRLKLLHNLALNFLQLGGAILNIITNKMLRIT